APPALVWLYTAHESVVVTAGSLGNTWLLDQAPSCWNGCFRNPNTHLTTQETNSFIKSTALLTKHL
uniref:Uncharacterized protein n=1 Tax=Pavo cristatus TaxID=9049 RepID=A0A8C9F580_PAVCR